MTDIAHHPLPQPDTQEVSLVGSHGVFIVGATVDVVKQKARQAPLGQAAVIGGGDRSDVVSSCVYAGFADKYNASRFPAPACGGRRLRSTALNNARDPSGPASFARLPNQGRQVAFGSMWLLPSFALTWLENDTSYPNG
jgi:hypothetical protein